MFQFVMSINHCGFRRALEIVSDFLFGVARASKPRSGLRFGASEGAEPLSPPKAGFYHSQSSEQSRARVISALDATNRRLEAIRKTNLEAAISLATACEPRTDDEAAFLLESQS